jgi:hypothetical protein
VAGAAATATAARATSESEGRRKAPLSHSGLGRPSGSAYAETITTGVPTETWPNSHSASGIRIRMQPCDAE